MPSLEQLVTFITAQYRWGLHPLKMLAALLAPVIIIWLADRYLHLRSGRIAEEEARLRRLPRTRRR